MKTRSSALYKRTHSYQRRGTPMLSAAVSLAFAAAPLVLLLWVVPVTGIGIA
ncbi:MAG: hypothetical protein ACAH11_10465 [Sphingomonas sp.]